MRKMSLVVVSVLTLGLLVALPCAADTQDSGVLNFQTVNQSMWKTGNAFSFTDNRNLFDLSLAGSGSLGPITTSSTGDVGVSTSLTVSGGTVNATVPVDVTVGFTPMVDGGAPINLTNSAIFGVGSLSTASPNMQASASVFANNLGGKIDVSGIGNLINVGPFTGSATLFSIDSRTFPPQTIDLGGGVNLTVGLPFVATNGTAGPQIFPPPLSISSSGGPSNFLGISANVTNIITNALGLPPLNGTVSIPGASASWNLLTITAGLNLGATQAFNLSATPLVAYQIHEVGPGGTDFTTTPMAAGTPFSFTPPAGVSAADVTPLYFLSADLMNNTSLALAATAELTALGVSASIGFCPVCVGTSLGPLVDVKGGVNLGSLSVFNDTFGLQGWNEFTGQTFEIRVPEPGTLPLLLFGTGLLALAGGLRRRSLLEA